MKKTLATILMAAGLTFANQDSLKIETLKDSLINRGIKPIIIRSAFSDPRFKLNQKILEYHDKSFVGQAGKGEITFEEYAVKKGLDIIVKRAKKFMSENSYELEKAEQKFGVPKEYITSILGMETSFLLQRYKGNLNVFNSVVSHYIYEDREKRKKLFLDQVEAMFDLNKKWGIDPLSLKGSFAGASSYAQFLPTSLRDYFVDSRGDSRRINLYSIADNIHSIANYLKEQGWTEENATDPSTSSAKAIYHYNNSWKYVKGVNYIAERIR